MNQTTETNAYNNVEFCHGIDANIVTDKTKILPWDAVKDKIIKQNPDNNLYEVTKPNKPIKIFIDIDGEANKKMTNDEFNIKVDSIINKLCLLDCAVMNSSKYEHIYIDSDGKEMTKHKYSFRLTFHKYISCISKMVAIIENEYFPMLKDNLNGIIDVDFGNKTEDCLNVDKSVYRSKGVGKMRAPNAYKGKTVNFRNNHYNSFEFDRPNHIIKGSIEDNLIHYIAPTDEFIDVKEEEPKNSIINIVKNKPNMTNDMTNVSEVKALLDLIEPEHLYEYSDWTKIIWAGKSCGVDEEFLKYISKKCQEKYSDTGFDKTYNAYSSPTNGLGTIKYYAKLSNEDKYYEICSYNDTTDNETISTLGTCENDEERIFISTDVLKSGASEIAECILPSIKDKLKYCKKKWCIYNEKTHLWDIDGTPAYMVIKLIKKYIKISINIVSYKLKHTDNDDETKLLTDNMKFYLSQLGAVDKPSFTSQIINHLKYILLDDDFYNKLDNNPYFLAFKNGLYDMRTKTLIPGGLKQEYYLTRTIDFDYEPSSDEHKDFVKDVLKKICNNNEEHLNYYLSVFGFALLGDPEKEKSCYFLVGQGGNNGKTLILDALREIMPCYTSKIDRQTFEEGYTKAHKHLFGVKGMRIVYVEELRKGKKVDECRLKEVADGKTIKNEVMFGTDEEINILFKLFFLSNHTPNFNPDNGVQNRYNQLQFNSQFTKDEEDINRLKFIRDEKMGDKLKNEYKHALMELLLEKSYEYIISGLPSIPLEFQEATKETINANNEFEMWFDENCEIGEDLRCGKEELIQCHPKIPFRELTDIMKGMGYKYERQKKKYDKKGVFMGFEIKNECLINL